MFLIPIYPTDPVEWCSQYEHNIMYYVNQIYFEHMFYKHYPHTFVLHNTFHVIDQLIKEMRAYIIAVNNYIENEKYLQCLISSDKMTNAIRPIIDRIEFHEKNTTNIYMKYKRLYNQYPPPPLPTSSPIVLEEDQIDFQIR